MRILIVSQYFWPESFRINELVNSLQKDGNCTITVLTGQPNYPDGILHKGYRAFSVKKEEHNGYPIYHIPLITRGKSGVRLFLNYISFMISGCLFGPLLLRKKSFDVILVYAPSPILQVVPGIILKWIKRAPLATWIGDLWPESLESSGYVKNKTILNLVRQCVKFIYRRNDLLLIQSRAFLNSVRKLSKNVPVEYFPNPGESIFSEEKLPQPSGLVLKQAFNIVYAGNMGGVQALDTLVYAADLLREEQDIHFTLIGSGSKGDWLKEEIVKRNLENVTLAGRFPSEYMPDIYEQADVLFVGLVKNDVYKITVPAKVQTYMAVGRPILCALEGEGADILRESGAGLVVEPENAAELAAAILKLKSMTAAQRKLLGDAGYRYYQQHFNGEILSMNLIERLKKMQRAAKRSSAKAKGSPKK